MRKAPEIWRRWGTANGNGLHSLQLKITLRCAALCCAALRCGRCPDAAAVAQLWLVVSLHKHAPHGMTATPARLCRSACCIHFSCSLHPVANALLLATANRRACELLRVGGRLVYSTCTFNPVEDEAVVAEVRLLCYGSTSHSDEPTCSRFQLIFHPRCRRCCAAPRAPLSWWMCPTTCRCCAACRASSGGGSRTATTGTTAGRRARR